MHSFNLIKLDETTSTNFQVHALLSDKAIAPNSVVVAKYQNQGKGQGDNTWLSEYGSNVLCSIFITPLFVKPYQQFVLSKVTSLAVIDTLHDFNLKGSVKWPNDIMVNKKKIAGILIENTIMSDTIKTSVIGIGLNVNQKAFTGLEKPTTSIATETGKDHDLDNVLDLLLDKFEFWYHKIELGDTDNIDIEYLESLYGLNRDLPFKMGNRTFNATITGVGESGKLYLRRDDGKIIKAVFREIEFL
jgi:BirA family transcriptional regulator, biotin operon repressor / biotin---[acetyl-CoA-carboxylase] ligase